ncbi:MAG: hypothetical protein QXO71_12220 [Candidatus Jordarchaeaceae archaeon]
MKLLYVQNRAVERKILEKREELPLTALEEDKLLGRHKVRLNISWEKNIEGRNKINISGGFPAKLYITESRIIITSEFYLQDKVSRFVGRIPIGWMRYNTIYVELAVDKIKKYSFGRFRKYIVLEPHGDVGETKINFYNLPKEERKLIKEDLETARIFKKPVDSGVVILDKPVAEIVRQRFAMLQHETIISKYSSKETELKKVTIRRVREKEAITNTTVETIQGKEKEKAEKQEQR